MIYCLPRYVNHKGASTVRIDIGRRVAEPVNVILVRLLHDIAFLIVQELLVLILTANVGVGNPKQLRDW
jgi:hypothetical protein